MQENFTSIKKSLKDFINKRDADMLSMIYFADSIAIASPYTKDKNFLSKSLDSIKVGDLGKIDTHLYDALMLSNSLKKTSLKSITILITDGIDKGSKTSIEELMSFIKDTNSTIYVIGYGDDFDEDVLKAIAQNSGGKFFKIDIKKLDITLKELNILYPKREFKKIKTIKEPLYQLPLFFAFLSLLFYTYLLNKRAVV
jgi:Ca-activated chloride channel family protein